MSKTISAVTIGKLIEAHMDGDNDKFLTYANFIADFYEEKGEKRAAEIIRKRINGEHEKESKIVLDKS